MPGFAAKQIASWLGLSNPASKKILKREPYIEKRDGAKGRERVERIKKWKKEGYSLEKIAERLGCDESTVKRIVKKMEDKNDDI